MRKSAICLLGLLAFIAVASRAQSAQVPEKWVRVSYTLADEQKTDEFIDMMRRAKAAGYTHLMLDDVYLQTAGDMPKSYFDNTARARKAADEIGITVAPVIFNLGYSWRVLYYDSNLAAGLPVRDARFIVKDGAASADPAAVPKMVNGGFEGAPGAIIAGWTADEASAPCVSLDPGEKASGQSSLRMAGFETLPDGRDRGCSVVQTLPVEPFKYYRLAIRRKTSGLKASGSTVMIAATDGKRRLCYTNFEVDPEEDWNDYVAADSDWREFQLTFNTLESTAIDIRIGVDNPKSGSVWWDDLTLEPAGLANVLRREATPLAVESADGSVVYLEGRDFEPVSDPQLGQSPMPEWLSALPRRGGSYDIWHQPPAIRLTADSRIKDGDTVLVSYYHPHIIYGHQVTSSITDPKVFDIFEQQMKWMKDLWDAPAYAIAYDEIRCGGWEVQPGGTHYTPGELLARHVARAYGILRKYSPEAKAYVWSDMFDPYHNARRLEGRHGYYLCNGDFYGAWAGLPKDIRIIKWGGGGRPCAEFFAARTGGLVFSGNSPEGVNTWLDATKGLNGVLGFMYTTWSEDYSGMEPYSKAIDDWKPGSTLAGSDNE